jgi:transcriptional regulator with XRE-family HTH domain
MDETVNQRIRQLRKELKLTQNEFSAIINISSGQLACIETEKRIVNSRTIKLICDSFKVNSEWLRTGKGLVYVDDHDNKYTKLIAFFDALKPKHQEFILASINWLLKMEA